MSIGSITSSGYGVSGLHPGDVASTFASDILRRAAAQPVPAVRKVAPEPTPSADPATATQNAQAVASLNAATAAADAQAADEKAAQGQKLQSALADTVSYMKEKFGDTAASTMMGLIYKRIGNGPVDEQSLGQGLLDTVKFVDQNFGIDKGDALIAKLNGNLNDSMNTYFDDGSNQEFIAKTILPGDDSASMETNLGQMAATEDSDAGADVAGAIKTLLESYKNMRDQNGLKKPRKLPGQIAGAYGDQAAFTPEPGVMVDAAA